MQPGSKNTLMSVGSHTSLPTYSYNFPAGITENVNLRIIANNFPGWDGFKPIDATFTIMNGGGSIIQSGVTWTAALSTGFFPTGSILRLVNYGLILGAGGKGGAGGCYGMASNVWLPNGYDGLKGGLAISLNYPIIISNYGTIAGGGGGGGGGSPSPNTGPDYSLLSGGGGGGGQGAVGGLGGYTVLAAFDGFAGQVYTPGAGGFNSLNPQAGEGGRGGTWGNAGMAGGSTPSYPGGNGGVAGEAITTNGNAITWNLPGTILGVVD